MNKTIHFMEIAFYYDIDRLPRCRAMVLRLFQPGVFPTGHGNLAQPRVCICLAPVLRPDGAPKIENGFGCSRRRNAGLSPAASAGAKTIRISPYLRSAYEVNPGLRNPLGRIYGTTPNKPWAGLSFLGPSGRKTGVLERKAEIHPDPALKTNVGRVASSPGAGQMAEISASCALSRPLRWAIVAPTRV
jgi:hypothetical protein